MQMKMFAFVLIAVLAVAGILYAQEEMGKAAMSQPDPAKELQMSVDRGHALFMDTKLGTNGKSCNSCHAEGGAVEATLGDQKLRAFNKLNTMYPRYWNNGRVMTLDQVVNFCLTHPLAGKELAADSQKLTDLVAYCASVVPAPMKKEMK
jgi:cytochrome c